MKALLVVPDSPGWRSHARAGIYSESLRDLGHAVTVKRLSKEQRLREAEVGDADVVFNHALQAPVANLEQLAAARPSVQFVHVNHSAIGYLETESQQKYRERLAQALAAARRTPNVWYGSVEPTVLQQFPGLQRVFRFAAPVPTVSPREYRDPSSRPVVAIVGRATPIKNAMNQLIAALSLGDQVQVELCMPAEPPWLAELERALGRTALRQPWMNHAKWLQYLRTRVDVVLQVSYAESFNNVACEAMQAGVPAVASSTIRFADPELQADPNSPGDIAAKVQHALAEYPRYCLRAADHGASAVAANEASYRESIAMLFAAARRAKPPQAPHPPHPPHPPRQQRTQPKRAVAVVAGDPESDACLDLTRPRMEAYADAAGATFVEIRSQPNRSYPIGNKWQVTKLAEQYDEILYLDCDVLVQPSAPCIFDLHEPGRFAMHDEFPYASAQRCIGRLRRVARSQRMRHVPRHYANGGVLLFDRHSADFYGPPTRPAPPMHELDQLLLTLQATQPLRRGRVIWLDAKWNWLFTRPEFWQGANQAYFIHLAGCRPIEYRLQVLRSLAHGDYTRKDPPQPLACVSTWC